MTASLDKRIEELESKTAYQDDTIHKLNEVVITQQKDIDLLNRKLDLLKDQIHSIGEGGQIENIDQPPPHY